MGRKEPSALNNILTDYSLFCIEEIARENGKKVA